MNDSITQRVQLIEEENLRLCDPGEAGFMYRMEDGEIVVIAPIPKG